MNTQIKVPREIYRTLMEIVIQVDSPGMKPFLEDFFLHYSNRFKQSGEFVNPEKLEAPKEYDFAAPDISDDSRKQLRLMALKSGSKSYSAYLREVLAWLASEYIKNGRVWFDDCETAVLPVRR